MSLSRHYYPKLSEVISVPDLPEFLDFAEQGLADLLDKIYFKNLQSYRSPRGDSAFYSLDIIANNIGLSLPFGMRLVLNPDEDGDPTISSFPISLHHKWEMLAYLRTFKVQNFPFTPHAFYDLGLRIFNLDDEEVITHTIDEFIESEEGVLNKFEQLVNDINAMYPSANLTLPPDQEPTASLLARLIRENENIPDTVSAVMFSLYIVDADLNTTRQNLQHFYQIMMPSGIEEYIRSLITPKIRATLTLSAGIEFPTNILQPVTVDGTPIPDRKTIFKFVEATFYADTEGGIGSEIELAGTLMPQYSQIGRTGFVIEFDRAKLDISRKRNIPEADLAGYGPDFVGLYIKRASVRYLGLGSESTTQTSIALVADDLLIGTGGLSGRIAFESEGVLYRQFGNFAAELSRFSVTFDKGQIRRSDIAGRLTIGGFRQGSEAAVIDIEVQIQDNGDFIVSAKPQAEFYTITLPDVLQLHIRGLKVGKEDRGFYVEVSGKLDFIADVPGLGEILPKGIDIQRFRIWDNGDLEFEGGNFTIPKTFRLKVGPVNMEISQISFGSYTRKLHSVERNYRYFGFDGMINTGRAGVNATGNGIKYYFTTDHNSTDKPFDSFTSIDAIGIDLTIPGNVSKDKAAFILNGYLSMSNPDPDIIGSNAGVEYTGAINFALPKLRLSGSAAMRLNPSVPAFIVDIGLELPVPIPLGPTGLGIYGFRGLIGQHYLPSKSATTPPLDESATWWEYYKAKSKITGREGIEIDKFASKRGFSVGAGVSLATSYDKGFTFSSKLFLLLGLPDVFLLQGQAGILRSRIGLTKDVDPPFSAFISIDRKSFMTGLGVNYRLPEGGGFDGGILKIAGTMELAFFFNNASGWYINLGKDQPENARIQASILSLFNGYAYLMISSRGFKAGAGARFDFNKKFGPVGVGLGAFIDLAGSLSFKPLQMGGRIQFGGYAYLRIWKFKLGLSVMVVLAVDSPNPFVIYGALEVSIRVIKRFRFKFEVGWTFNRNSDPLFEPIEILRLPNEDEGYMPAAAINILSNEAFPINYVNSEITGTQIIIPAPGASGWRYDFNEVQDAMRITIPLDSFIDIDLLKAVKPGNSRIGGAANQLPDGYIDLVPSQKGLSAQVAHELQFLGLDIFCWSDDSGGSWKPYYIYEAVTAIARENDGEIDLRGLKDGYWQFNEPNRFNKIRLLSQNMFTLASDHAAVASDMSGLNYERKDLFCYEHILRPVRINWEDEPVSTTYADGDSYYNSGMTLLFNSISGTVQAHTGLGPNRNLHISEGGGYIEILLQEPLTHLEITLGATDHSGYVEYFYTRYTPRFLGKNMVQQLPVSRQPINPSQENQTIVYDDLDRSVQRVILYITPKRVPDFKGDFVIGGHFSLPTAYIPVPPGTSFEHLYETQRSLAYVSLYGRSIAAEEVLQPDVSALAGLAGRWIGADRNDSVGVNHGVITGSPNLAAVFWKKATGETLQLQRSYTYTANADSITVPYDADLEVEQGDFALAITAVFNSRDMAGVSTLVAKVWTDPDTGERKGFALHLCRMEAVDPFVGYDEEELPRYQVVLTCYDGYDQSAIHVEQRYMSDCATGRVASRQYVNIVVSVDRLNNKLDVYINRELKASSAVPEELGLVEQKTFVTQINELTYLSESIHRRVSENQITRTGFIEENQLLNDNMNKVIQPVWRPETTYAIVVKTRDVVNNDSAGAVQKNFVYGFKTAGPVGHFHERSALYQDLLARDEAAQFKLSGLKYYIDYERSSPDALGRYDLSKPVFFDHPKVSLFFAKPYINAMFDNWEGYQGLASIKSKLDVKLLDPYGSSFSPELVWEQLPDQEVNETNYRSLPPDQQVLYLLNRSAAEDGCNTSPVVITKKKKRGSYQFPQVLPNRLYTAVFEAVYQPDSQEEKRAEVHRFGFKTSRFANFAAQCSSFILADGEEGVHHAIQPLYLNISSATLNDTVMKVWQDDYQGNEADVLRYAIKYDRLLFGALRIRNLEPIEHTVIHPVIHIDAANENKRLVGVVIRNPEPFNNPKLASEQLNDTIIMKIQDGNGELIDHTIAYVHAGDTSAVFMSNQQLDMPEGMISLDFKYKIFNGEDYSTEYETYTSPVIHLSKG